MTADDTKGEDSPKTTKKRRRRRRKKTTKGVEKRAALEYQLVLEQQKNQALEKKILRPLLQGFEPATFQSRVRRSNH